MATEQVIFAVPAKPSRRAKVSALSRFLKEYFYFCMSLLVAAVVIYGFSHTVDENLIHATPPAPWILWVHGVVFSGWLAFFIFQSALVRTGNVKLHRLTGWFGAALGVLIPVLGISTAIIMDRFRTVRLHEVGVNPFFSIQASDIAAFTVFFWLAIYWRKKPEYHRRLVLIATIALTDAGFGRFPGIGPHLSFICVDALISLGIARDLIVNRRIHLVYRYALPILIVCQLFAVEIWLRHPAWWVKVANAIIMG